MFNLKFRAWHKKSKQMFHVRTINFDTKVVWLVESDLPEEDAFPCFYEDEYEIMQYIGVYDEQQVEICQGDIINIWNEYGIDYNAQIVFMDGGFCAIDGFVDDYSLRRYSLSRQEFNVKIVGNVYENSDLLS